MNNKNLRQIIRKIILENQNADIEPSLLKKIEIQLPSEYKKEGNIFPIQDVETGKIINFKWSQNQLQQVHLNEDLKSNLTKGLAALCLIGSTLTSCDKVNDRFNKDETACVLKNGVKQDKVEYKLYWDVYMMGGTNYLYLDTHDMNMFFNRELTDDEKNTILSNAVDILSKNTGYNDTPGKSNPIKDNQEIRNVRIEKNLEIDKWYGEKCLQNWNLTRGFPDGRSDFFGVQILK
jgi:hypothetical protein